MNRVVTNADKRITLKYGNGHLGVDLAWVGGDGDNVYAHSDGKVIECVTGKKQDLNTKDKATYGNYITIEHPNGYFTRYAHLSNVDVKLGDMVTAGTKIGYIGMSGKAYGKHLHFEARGEGRKVLDPTAYLDTDLPNMPNGSIKKDEPVTPIVPEESTEIKENFEEGDKVVPTKLIDYNGTPVTQYDDYYTITEIVGNRAVLSARGQVWAAMHTDNIKSYSE